MTIDVLGECLTLRADRTLLWGRTLVLADPHFGKATAFRAAAIPVPGGCAETLERIHTALIDTRAERLVILGDFWHDRTGIDDETLDSLHAWKRDHASVDVVLIRGNHDRAPPPWGTWSEPLVESPFVFAHHPVERADGYVLAGHIHPGVVLHGRGRERLRLPAFRFGPVSAVLPAFGAFTGLDTTWRYPIERRYAIAGSMVIEVP